jgi:nitric oxide reductase NorD protein
MGGLFDIFEPEETVGKLWDMLIRKPTDLPHFPDAGVELPDLLRLLGVFFRALGGDPGVELKAAGEKGAQARLGFWRRLGQTAFVVPQARIDGDTLLLPEKLDILPERELNRDLYFWLTGWAAATCGQYPRQDDDPLRQDALVLRHAHRMTLRTLKLAPGLRARLQRLSQAVLAVRPRRMLPEAERWVEEAIEALLKAAARGRAAEVSPDDAPENPVWRAVLGDEAALRALSAPKKYHPFLPVSLWAEATSAPAREKAPEREEGEGAGGGGEEEEQERAYNAARRNADQADRKDSLILNRFEHIIALAEFFNVSRMVDDETDEEEAKKARDDLDEISVVEVKKRPKTKLKFDLDLAPEDVEHERLAAEHVYPEWDYRKRAYLPDHCRVLAAPAPEDEAHEWQPDEATLRRIRAVRRQFEALRPKREVLRRQLDGEELDTDALVRAMTDLRANGEGSDQIWMTTRQQGRDLAVSVLFDTSRSTESWVQGRQVIDIAREALTALSEGLAASGDAHALHAFSSVRRDRVYVHTIKGFDERHGARIRRRIAALRPGFYTRLGAAVRHVGQELLARPNSHRLLLIITDGKPNDVDHYEGRYGVEDTRKAILEMRKQGLRVFGITIDRKAQSHFAHMFGRSGHAVVSRPALLTRALPLLYRHLIA